MMSIEAGKNVVVFTPRKTFEAPVTEVNEDDEIFKVTLKAGGKMSFRFPNPFGNCEGYGHNVNAKVKGHE